MSIDMRKRQTYKNIAMNILAFGVQFVISFYISPIIVGKVGASAYGFIGMANDFVSYAAILTTVFNSVAARFIANSFYQKDFQKANCYFNSLIISNTIIAGIIGVFSIILVPNINSFIDVPAELLYDVKLTFALIFGSYIITVITLVFTTSTFVTNRTDIQGVRNIINHFVRLALIIVFLNFVSIKIYWIAVATLIAGVVVAIMNVGLTKKLTPELRINLRDGKKSYALELAKSGCWMAFSNISVILMRGLDLIIANNMIGSHEMGLLSIARTMPNNVTSIINTIAPIFTPVFLAFFAQNNMGGLVSDVKKSIKTMAQIMFVPVCGFMVFSYDFYKLWQHSLFPEEIMTVTVLSCVTLVQAFFNSTTSTMAQLSVVANKLKMPVFVSFGCGVLNVIVIVMLLKFTSLGVYAIVISSTAIMILRYVLFNSMYAAYVLNQPLKTFIGTTVKSWLTIPLLFATMIGFKILMPVHSWLDLLIVAAVCAVVGYAEILLLYSRKSVFGKFMCLIRKIKK